MKRPSHPPQKTLSSPISRRRFLAASGAMMALPHIVISNRISAAAPESDELVAAVIGMGGRGTSMAWHQFGHRAQVAAVCDADLRKAEKAAAIIEKNLGYRPDIYQDYRQVLERSDIDVIGNATPDHWHTQINLDACRAGKDIYAEKPLTFTIDEGKLLRDVARTTGRIIQVGTQQRSDIKFRIACELVRNGRIGRLRQVAVLLPFNTDNQGGTFDGQPVPAELNWDLWQGQAPDRPFCPQRLAYRRWHEYAAGMITDWGHHHFDIAHWGMGMDDSGPLSVDARGYLLPVDKVNGFNNIDVFAAHLRYPGDIDLWCLTVRDDNYLQSLEAGYPTAKADADIYDDVPEEIKREKKNGILFMGDRGNLFVSRGILRGKAADERRKNPLPADAIRLYQSNDHMGNLFDCIKTRKDPICPVEQGHRSVTPCHLVNLSMRLQRKLAWDSAKEEIVGDTEANQWLSRPQRSWGRT